MQRASLSFLLLTRASFALVGLQRMPSLKDSMQSQSLMVLPLELISVQMQISLKLLDLMRRLSLQTLIHLSGMVMTQELLVTTILRMAKAHSV